MEFTGVDDCGNSPKNIRLAQWERSLALGAWDEVVALLADDVRLLVAVAGRVEETNGRDAVRERLREVRGDPASGALDGAITHGRLGAAWGSWARADGDVQFAHAFRFTTTTATALALIRLVHSAPGGSA